MNASVILYKPNLIGYARLVLLFIAMFCSETPFIVLYLASVSLDYFDGMVAREFGEESKLGACLDMITDRISTTVLCIKIIAKKPYYIKRCMIYIFVDLLSHFLQFTSMIYVGVYHKSFEDNRLLKIYYDPYVLKMMCVGSEAYFAALYYTKKSSVVLNVLFAIPVIKTFFHLVHLYVGICVLSTVKNSTAAS